MYNSLWTHEITECTFKRINYIWWACDCKKRDMKYKDFSLFHMGLVVEDCKPSSLEAEVGGSQGQGQPG